MIFDINLLGVICQLRQYRWGVLKLKWGDPPNRYSHDSLFRMRPTYEIEGWVVTQFLIVASE